MNIPHLATDGLDGRISAAFGRMLLLGEMTQAMRDMVEEILEGTEDQILKERLAEELELAAEENEDLLAHLRVVHFANGERVDGSRLSNAELDGTAAAAERRLNHVRRRLLDLLLEVRALRRWSKYRFQWEKRLISRRFPRAPVRRRPPPDFVEPLESLDRAKNHRRSLMLEFSQSEMEWSIRNFRSHELLILGLWWRSSRRWYRYNLLRWAVALTLTILIGVFGVGAITSGLEYLWGCGVSLFLLIAQHLFLDPHLRRALAAQRTKALGDGALSWAQARVFAAVTASVVEMSWRRVRDEERRIPDDPELGVIV